ncbi:hypothetical protein ACHAWF_004981 [Thalassiosira exigua]
MAMDLLGASKENGGVEWGIEWNWQTAMPKQSKTFLLETPDSIDLLKLVQFWSSPAMIQYTRSGRTGGTGRVMTSSFLMAYAYLTIGRLQEATALALNGAFFLQCMDTSIETIADSCRRNNIDKLTHFSEGMVSVDTRELMKQYLERKVPKSTGICSPPANDVMKVVNKVGDGWNGRGKKNHQKSPPEKSQEARIELVLVDDSIKDGRQTISIGASTTLKTLFNDYAVKRGVSLRSLRFSYNGRSLFLSAVGNKTPEELNMHDQDVLTVNGTVDVSAESNTNKPRRRNNASHRKSAKNGSKRSKVKSKRKTRSKPETSSMTSDECRLRHSKLLTTLHEEAEPRLRKIRMRLNALDIERQPQKSKSQNKRGLKEKEHPVSQFLHSATEGKAGKPHFMIHVGEVANLYKTTKPTLSHRTSSYVPTLDLHGYTREEAIVKLDESLPMWFSTAMKGSYPFVLPAKIICGCGNQLISETVATWIRTHAQVANSPKGHPF